MTGNGDIGGEYAIPARSSLRGVTLELWEATVEAAYAAEDVRNDAVALAAIQARADLLSTLENEQIARTPEAYQRLRVMGQSRELEGHALLAAYEAVTRFCDPEGFKELEGRLHVLYDGLNESGALFAYDDSANLMVCRRQKRPDGESSVNAVILEDATMRFEVYADAGSGDPEIVVVPPAGILFGKEAIATRLSAEFEEAYSDSIMHGPGNCEGIFSVIDQSVFIGHTETIQMADDAVDIVADGLSRALYESNDADIHQMIRFLQTYNEEKLVEIRNSLAVQCVIDMQVNAGGPDYEKVQGATNRAMRFVTSLASLSARFKKRSPEGQTSELLKDLNAFYRLGMELNPKYPNTQAQPGANEIPPAPDDYTPYR